MDLFYRLTVTNREGEIVRRTGLRKSRSFVQQVMQILRCGMTDDNEASVTDIDGDLNTIFSPSNSAGVWFYADSVADSDTRGILVGTDDTAVDMTDTALGALIADGTGSGQLTRSAVAFTTFAQAGDVAQFYMTRSFTNGSGATINVTEAGLAGEVALAPSSQQFLFARDVFAAEAVDDGDSLLVEYAVRCTRGATNHFLEALVQHLLCALSNVDTACHDTGGVERTIEKPSTADSFFLEVDAAAAADDYGLIIGTDDGTILPIAVDNSALGAQIAEADMAHGAMTVNVFTQAGDDASVSLTRTFTNVSGGDITVSEYGLVCRSKDTGAATRYFLLMRRLPTAETISDGDNLTIQHTIKVSL